jgi:Zn-dependent protease
MKKSSSMMVAFILAKGPLILKSLKALKFAKPMITLLSMSASAFAYALYFGSWWFGLGLTLMLLIHEMGHVIAIKVKGFPASAPVFIPFLGAAIFMPPIKDRANEAYVGYGGPLLGSLAGVLAYGVWTVLPGDHHVLLILSYFAISLNLFNLLPLRPLDGGRILHAVTDHSAWIGAAALLVLSAYVHQPWMFFVWILVLPDLTFFTSLVRLVLGLVCYALMSGLMLGGFSDQLWFVDAIDMFVGLCYLAVLVIRYRGGDAIEDFDVRPLPPTRDRVKWAVLYTLMATLLIVLLSVQISQLPRF